MGFLTTVTFWNDRIHEIMENPKEVCERIYHAASGARSDDNFMGLGKIHKLRHADDHTLYVHMGNTVCEMGPYSHETERIMRECPDFFMNMLDYIEGQVPELKRRFEEIKSDE